MSTYYHENVQHKNNIPAFIALLDGEDIQHYFQQRFLYLHTGIAVWKFP